MFCIPFLIFLGSFGFLWKPYGSLVLLSAPQGLLVLSGFIEEIPQTILLYPTINNMSHISEEKGLRKAVQDMAVSSVAFM